MNNKLLSRPKTIAFCTSQEEFLQKEGYNPYLIATLLQVESSFWDVVLVTTAKACSILLPILSLILVLNARWI